MHRLFITSTGTGIGKTLVTAALAHQWRVQGESVRALKPVISGWEKGKILESDTGVLLQAQNLPINDEQIARISPWRFAAPLSPDMAAAKEKKNLNFGELMAFSKEAGEGDEERVLIEGVGGLMVPLNHKETVLDWMTELDWPVLLVVGSYLGTLSHTLTAWEVLRSRKLEVAAVIVSESETSDVPLDETCETLRRFIHAPVRAVPRLSQGCAPWKQMDGLAEWLTG